MITSALAEVHAVMLSGGTPPTPPAIPIPGLDQPGQPLYVLLGWGKWLMFFLGFAGLLMCAAQMAIGRRNSHRFAADGAAGIPWVLGALALTAIAGGIVGVFVQP